MIAQCQTRRSIYSATAFELIAIAVQACDNASATANELARTREIEFSKQLEFQGEMIKQAARDARVALMMEVADER